MSSNGSFQWAELPEIVESYLKAHVVADFETAVTFLADDVTVVVDAAFTGLRPTSTGSWSLVRNASGAYSEATWPGDLKLVL